MSSRAGKSRDWTFSEIEEIAGSRDLAAGNGPLMRRSFGWVVGSADSDEERRFSKSLSPGRRPVKTISIFRSGEALAAEASRRVDAADSRISFSARSRIFTG